MIPQYDVLLSLGSNIAPMQWLPAALTRLAARFPGVAISQAYASEAVGPAIHQPPFVNLAVRLRTDCPYRALRTVVRHIEEICGRRRGPDRYAPRTLDIDIVDGDARFRATAGGRLPDPELSYVAHVLVPCAELWPEARDPASGDTLAERAALIPDPERARLARVAFPA